jgi:hypothetical protein
MLRSAGSYLLMAIPGTLSVSDKMADVVDVAYVNTVGAKCITNAKSITNEDFAAIFTM